MAQYKKLDIVAGLAVDIVAGLSLLAFVAIIIGTLTASDTPPIEEKFQVTTKAGETFEIDASHRCGKSLKKAATQVFGVQDTLLNEMSLRMLPAVVRDLTHIYDNNIRKDRRCDILRLNVKAIEK